MVEADHPPVEEVRLADEGGDEAGRRLVVERVRRADLLQPAVVHDGDPVGHHQRLLLVVGDVDDRHPQLVVQRLDLQLEPFPQLLVERAERLVHQQHPRVEDEGPGERDPLLLAAGELAGETALVAGQADQLQHLPGPLPDLRLRHFPQVQREADVLADRHVREEGVVLEDHADVAPPRRHRRHRVVVDPDLAGGRRLEAGQHHQGRRLARAGRPEQGHELPRRDVDRDAVDRVAAASRVRLLDPVEADPRPEVADPLGLGGGGPAGGARHRHGPRGAGRRAARPRASRAYSRIHSFQRSVTAWVLSTHHGMSRMNPCSRNCGAVGSWLTRSGGSSLAAALLTKP